MNDISADDLALCQRGDVRGLEAIYAAYGDRVYRLCLHLLGQAADAEDAAQEVFLRLFENARQFDGRSRFGTWLYRVTVNHCLNRRKRRRDDLVSLVQLGEREQPLCPRPSPLAASARSEERDQLSALLARLTPERRAVFVLREIDGLSYRQIADVLELPIGTVMSRLARAREELMLELERYRSHTQTLTRDAT